MKKKHALILTIVTLTSIASVAAEMSVFETNRDASSIAITGTSTLHDWHIHIAEFSASISLSEDAASADNISDMLSLNDPEKTPSLQVQIPVSSLESGKKGMDKVVYETLQMKEHPTITFSLKTLALSSEPAPEEAAGTPVILGGTLIIAGQSRDVEIEGVAKLSAARGIVLSGSLPMKMTDFDIEPPKAMMGMVKAGDDITIEFKWTSTPATANP